MEGSQAQKKIKCWNPEESRKLGDGSGAMLGVTTHEGDVAEGGASDSVKGAVRR